MPQTVAMARSLVETGEILQLLKQVVLSQEVIEPVFNQGKIKGLAYKSSIDFFNVAEKADIKNLNLENKEPVMGGVFHLLKMDKALLSAGTVPR